MNKNAFLLILCFVSMIAKADTAIDLSEQLTSLQQAQKQLQQSIDSEQTALEQLQTILHKMTVIKPKAVVHFAGRDYSAIAFAQQMQLLQNQRQYKLKWLKRSRHENELLKNRIRVIEWRINIENASRNPAL